MNIQEYIASGQLEAYALGALTEQEAHEVEAAIAQYPELRQELDAIEAAMLGFAQANAVQPPAHLQDAIWASLDKGAQQAPPPEAQIPKTIPLGTGGNKNWARAAVWIALVGSLLANFILWGDRNKAQNEMTAMKQNMDAVQDGQNELIAQIKNYQQERFMMMKPDMKPVVMHGEKDGHKMTGVVYWSKEKGEAYVSLLNMPTIPQGMQYQLWVIQDGKPVSMGVIANDMMKGGMQKSDMQITSGQAFAISLEKEGGNPTPTTVMVVGAMG